MTVLPIVDATLRQNSRKRWTYWSRVAAVGGMSIFVIPLVLAIGEYGVGAAPFGSIIAGFSPFVLLILLNIGAAATIDCIASEKREGTLGLLFLTDLKGWDIVLGKLAAAFTQIWMSWLAMLPLAALLVLTGGFTWQDIARIVLAIGNGLFCGAAAGLLGSSLCRERKNATNIAGLWVLATCILPPAAAGLLLQYTNLKTLPEVLFAIGPGPGFFRAFSSVGGPTPGDVWIQLLASHGVAWVAVGLACRFTPRRWQDRPARDATPNPAITAAPARTQTRHRDLLGREPFAWLMLRYHWSPTLLWCGLAFGLGLFGLIQHFAKLDRFEEIVTLSVWLAFFAHFLFKSKIGAEATQGIYDQKRSGALEHLLLTGVTPWAVVAAHWRSLRRQFGPPMLALLALDLCFAFACALKLGTLETSRRNIDGYIILLVCWCYLPAALIGDTVVLVWVGMWEAVRTKKKWAHVRGNAFAYAVLGPAGVYIALWIAFMYITDGEIESFWLFILTWTGFSAAAGFAWLKYCRNVVWTRFRKLVQETSNALRST